MSERKPILCLDFDGVLHAYTTGWTGADNVADGPTNGALDFLATAVDHFVVAIYSSRSHQEGGIAAMKTWLRGHLTLRFGNGGSEYVLDRVTFPTSKPAAMVTIDDRALMFDGAWPSIESLLAFKPWNKIERFVSPGTPPTPREREMLELLIEECAEVQQRATKWLRFGGDEVQPKQSSTNTQRLGYEIGDVLAVVAALIDERIVPTVAVEQGRTRKRLQLLRFLQTERSSS